MDKKVQILLGSQKNIASVNTDSYDKIELSNVVSELMEYDVNDAVNSTEVFDREREENLNYRIYGKIEYLSLLNGIKTGYPSGYKELQDFFNPTYAAGTKDVMNSFQFYLTRAARSGYTKITGGSTSELVTNFNYIVDEKFDDWVIASPTNYPYGWEVSAGVGSYIQQTPSNQAKFVLGNQFINLISIGKEVPEVYGNFILETNISAVLPSFDPAMDGISVILSRNGVFVTSFALLSTGIGYKRIEFSLPQSSGFTRIGILAGSINKSIVMDYFKIYQTGETTSSLSITPEGYMRYFEVIATPNDFEIYPAGFSNNVYGEQTYAFSFRKDFNVSQYFDEFGFPATELFLYAQYVPSKNGNNVNETMKYTKQWTNGGSGDRDIFTPTTLNVGDYVKTSTGAKIGDLIDYVKSEFIQTQLSEQTVYITTECKIDNISKNIVWKFNPFIPFRLRYFANELSSANTGNTSYDVVSSIPSYATKMDNEGNYVWREILPQGYTEPLTGLGVDYPFINKRRYLFSNIMLNVMPDLKDSTTATAFRQIWYSRNATLMNTQPKNDLNNIGKPCQ